MTEINWIGYKHRTEPEGDIRILLYGYYRKGHPLLNSGGLYLDVDKN